MKEERANSSRASRLTNGDDAIAELVSNLRDADQWTERTFRKLYGHLPQHEVAQVLHELRKRRTRTDLEALRSESSWAHDRLRRVDQQRHDEEDEVQDLSF
jgi:predicted nucleic acid-binding protein